jgi:hypothetical protein
MGSKKITPGDGPHVKLDGPGPVLDVAKFLQFVVEAVDELKPVLSLIYKDNFFTECKENNFQIAWVKT